MSIFSKLQSLLTAANTATGESDTTITGAMQTLIDGYGQGSGVRYAEGTFTLANDGAFPTITHNLGTTKIAGFVVPHHNIVAHAGYRNYLSFFINWIPFTDGEEWTKDFTTYNSTHFPDIITVNGFSGLRMDTGYASPWTSQSNQWSGNYYDRLSVTDTTVRVGANGTWCSGTYYYKIFALE